MATIHNTLPGEQQFHPDKGYTFVISSAKDSSNKKVKVCIAEEVQLSKENEFSKCLIESKNIVRFLMHINFHIGAIQRYFESRRCNWRESNSWNQGK